MAKGSGNTRGNSAHKWDGDDSYEGVVREAQYIFNQEATAGLGNFKQRKPQQVTDEKYEELLKSGDYIEVYHGSKGEGVNGLTGKYYVNNDLHVSGFGYYFSTSEDNASSYSDGGYVAKALIRKSDILDKDVPNLMEKCVQGAEKYIGKNAKYKNGKGVSRGDMKDFYNKSTVAARNGHKAVGSGSSSIVVIDRSVLIMRKK